MASLELVPGESCFNLNFGLGGGGSLSVAEADGDDSSDRSASPKRSRLAPSPSAAVVPSSLPNGKKTKGRVKIKMEYIENKLRRYTTFSKRKTGIMKKAYELSTLTGTQVMLLVASETGHVYTFATRKLRPMITSDAGKNLIQTCLNSPDPHATSSPTQESITASVESVAATSSASPPTKAKSAANGAKDGNSSGGASSAGGRGYYGSEGGGGGRLPTMVAPAGGAYAGGGGGGGELDDSDDSSSEHSADGAGGSPMSRLTAALADPPPTTTAAAAAAAAASDLRQMLFPTQSVAAGALGLVPGFAPGGALMYQVPQGVVYAAPTSMTMADGQQQNGGGGFMFGIPTNDASGQQQFITIPVPLNLQQMQSAVNSQALLGAESSKG